jgi:hypothetical protein
MFGQVGGLVVVESEAQPQNINTLAQNTNLEIRVMDNASVILASRRRTIHIESLRQLYP